MRFAAIALPLAILLSACATPPQVQTTGSLAAITPGQRYQIVGDPEPAYRDALRERLNALGLREAAGDEKATLRAEIRFDVGANRQTFVAPRNAPAPVSVDPRTLPDARNIDLAQRNASSGGETARPIVGLQIDGYQTLYHRRVQLILTDIAQSRTLWAAYVTHSDPHMRHADYVPPMIASAFAGR